MQQKAHRIRGAFVVCASLFAVWYLVGLVLLGTGWIPSRMVEMSRVWGDVVFLLLAAAVTVLYSAMLCGAKASLRISGLVLAVSACAELVGAHTGYPFGRYQYTDNLGPQLFGSMPLIIPFCWLTIVLNSFWLAYAIFQEHMEDPSVKFSMITTAAFLAVLTDLNLEPVASMVKLYWIWLDGGTGYYGIPGINFFGWWLVTFFILNLAFPHLPAKLRIPVAPWPAYFILAAVNLLFALMNYRAGFYIPVFFALNGIGGLGILLYWKSQKNSQ
jgi:bisanhydrobacterioruberin hydratase